MKLQYKAINPEDQATADKLLSKVTVDENGCWRYRANITPDATYYCKIRRQAYALFVDSTVDKNCFITTTCGNKLCINPSHQQRLKRTCYLPMLVGQYL